MSNSHLLSSKYNHLLKYSPNMRHLGSFQVFISINRSVMNSVSLTPQTLTEYVAGAMVNQTGSDPALMQFTVNKQISRQTTISGNMEAR